MKNGTFRPALPKSSRPRKRGTSRLFVLGAAFAASTTMTGAGVTPAQAAQVGRNEQSAVRFDIPAGP